MRKKSIAAALLVAMVAWAEMALAPMFAIHAGQVHPARATAEHQTAHGHVMPPGHPCCPELRKTEIPSLIELVADSHPCDDQHRCCFRQGPQSVPAPVSSGHRLSQEVASAKTAEPSPAQDAESRISPASGLAPGSPPGVLGMVLRI